MDFVNKFTGGDDNNNNNQNNNNSQQGGLGGDYNNNQQQQSSSGSNSEGNSSSGGGGGFMDKLNGLVGGGRESEKNEDYLDKGVDYVQEKFMGQGPQDNENAVEQAKDEKISDFIREQYKSRTGSDFPVADKETRLG